MAKKLPFIKERLFCPGPTPVPLRSRLLMVDQLPYHRASAFYSSFLKCQEMLTSLLGANQPPLILTCSGTGAMEAAIVNFTEPQDKILCLVGGKFGERWAELGHSYGCQVQTLSFPWGEAPSVNDLAQHLQKDRTIKAVFFQSCETSTAVQLPVQELAATINKYSDALVVVDCISSLGAHPLRMKEWGIDLAIAGSQKGLSTPPGLGFIGISERAQQRWSKRPKYYFDLSNELQCQKKGQTCFTPAIGIVLALEAALEEIFAFGLDEYFAFHHHIARGVRKALQAMGLKLLAEGCFSNSLTAAYVPQGIPGEKLVKVLQEKFAMTFAGGQGALQGKIVRCAHLGMFDYFDICAGLVALEQALQSMGHTHTLGTGISAFMQETKDYI